MRSSGAIALILATRCAEPSPPLSAPGAERPTVVRRGTEPSKADGLAAAGLLGTIEHSGIRETFESNWEQVQRCYRNGAKRKAFIGGEIELTFRVTAEGRVRHVYVSRSDLGAWPVERCMLELAQTFYFPRPTDGEAEFSFTLLFAGSGTVTSVDETLTASLIDQELVDLERCLPAERNAYVPMVIMTLYLTPRGRVTSAGFATPEGDDGGDWRDCAYETMLTSKPIKVRRWKLPKRTGRAWKLQSSYSPS